MAQLSEAAFGEVYRRATRPLWTYVYRVTGSAPDSDDIVQETFCRLLRAEVGELGDEELRRYLFRVAGNLLVDRWRRSARERGWLERIRHMSIQASAHLHIVASDAEEEMPRIFAALKPRDRALLWLAYVEEHDHRQIAEALRVGPASVKVLLSRARARLRDLLNATAPPAGK